MSKTKAKNQLSFLNQFEEDYDSDIELENEWHEAPQNIFLSWPDSMQFAYCAKRDLDSARHCEGELADWYRERASYYQGMA